MNIADLFINIEIKGSKETGEALATAGKGLSGLKETSIQTKAALLAAFYGLEQITSSSARAGTELVKYNNLTGFSISKTQEWANAFRQVGVEQTEVMSTGQGLQNAIAKWKNMGAGDISNPFSRMGAAVPGLNLDSSKFEDIQGYLMPKMIEYLQKDKDNGRRNLLAGMVGLTPDIIQGGASKEFNFERDKNKGGINSDATLHRLDNVRKAWSNINREMEVAMNKFVGDKGLNATKEIEKLIPPFMRLAESVNRLATSLHAFELIGRAIDGWGLIFGGGADLVTSMTPGGGESHIWKDLMNGDLLNKIMDPLEEASKYSPNAVMGGWYTNDNWKKNIVKPPQTNGKTSEANTKVEQHLAFNVGPGQTPQGYADAVQPLIDAATSTLLSGMTA